MKPRSSCTLLFTSLLVLSLACHGNKNEQTASSTTDAPVLVDDISTATAAGSPGGTAIVPSVAAGTTVAVILQDGHIAIKGQTIPPGPAILTVENGGTQVHNLFIEGEGISRAAGDNLAPKETTTVDVVFRPGTYTLYCPVLDHRKKGEEETITIAAPAPR
jgi:hypothetical protein